MNIQGYQKLTLLDFPGKVACTVFTGGCNFRCPFCHNASLVTDVHQSAVSEGEILGFLKKRQGILDGVCITGGEPLLNRDIPEFIKKIRELGFSVKLDTNGSFPVLLRELIEQGLLDYVAMDIKNSKEKYGVTVGNPEFDIAPICESVELLKAGKVSCEFRTTVTGTFHTVDDIVNIGKWLQGCERYYLQSFVDSGNLLSQDVVGCDKNSMKSMLEAVFEYIPRAELRGV